MGSQQTRCVGTRRHCLSLIGAGIGLGLAGCIGNDDDTEADLSPWGEPIGNHPTTWDELGHLEGELTVYSGRTPDQIDPLFEQIEDAYPDFTIATDYDDNVAQVNKLIEEGDATHADIFYTQDSGALAVVKDEGLLRELPEDIGTGLPSDRTDPDGVWMGVSGRVRAVQYNTELWDDGADDLPTDIREYAYDDRFEGIISVRPNSGSFRAFIVAMMELEGEEATREWVRAMVEDQDVRLFSSGSQQATAVNDGDVAVALGNQYYVARILNEDPEASIDVAFTQNDAGCLFNVSGIGIPNGTTNASLAAEFARHLVTREGQEFFVEVNGEYPVVDGIEYVGELPPVEEINPPDFDLNQLGLELTEAVDLLTEEGMTV